MSTVSRTNAFPMEISVGFGVAVVATVAPQPHNCLIVTLMSVRKEDMNPILITIWKDVSDPTVLERNTVLQLPIFHLHTKASNS